MCTLGFQGKGYSPSFIRNYQKIVDRLRTDPETQIQVTCGLDHVCRFCPHNIREKGCAKQTLIEKLDHAHQEVLGWQEHQVVRWSEAQKIIAKRMTLEAFHHACAGCSWKALGVCEAALKNLIENDQDSLRFFTETRSEVSSNVHERARDV